MPRWCLPVAVLLLLGVIWGSITNVARYVGQSTSLTPISYAFWTLLIAGVILLAINLIRRRPPILSTRHLGFYLVTGALGSAVPTSNMFWSLKHISAGHMSIVLATVPLFTYALALILRLEPFDRRRMIGVGLGFAGAAILLLSRPPQDGGENRIWFVLAFLTPLFYALGNHFTARFRPSSGDSLSMANGMVISAAVILFVVAQFEGGVSSLSAEGGNILKLVLFHGLLSGIAFSLFFVLIKIAGPVYFSQVAYLVCIFGIGIGMIVVGERYGPSLWVATIIVFLGILLVNITQRAHEPEAHKGGTT